MHRRNAIPAALDRSAIGAIGVIVSRRSTAADPVVWLAARIVALGYVVLV